MTTKRDSRPWTPGAVRMLHRASRAHTSVTALTHMLKRTEGAIRQKARSEGLAIGVHQRGVSTAKLRASRRQRAGL